MLANIPDGAKNGVLAVTAQALGADLAAQQMISHLLGGQIDQEPVVFPAGS
ncbi:hypothetical protein D3C81_2275580 [compost metagenome]